VQTIYSNNSAYLSDEVNQSSFSYYSTFIVL